MDARYRDFADRVVRAHAQARLSREIAVANTNPLAWLRLGPGRDRGPDEPGWTEPARPSEPVPQPGAVPPEAVRVIRNRLGGCP